MRELEEERKDPTLQMTVFNSVTSSLSEELLEGLDTISISELYEILEKVEFVSNLTNPNRKRVKDLERWDNPNLPAEDEVKKGDPYRKLNPKGRIRVDLENPHILEDMEYFRPAARHFEEFGCYTKFSKNRDPDSDYMRFWAEERKRCLEGYVRESDGEWIPGYLYHFWNYGRVMVKIKTGKRTAVEKEAFPKIYDSHYWWFHYIERAETLGLFGDVLKKRRWGYSFMLGNMLCRNYSHIKQSKSYILAYQKEYLYKDGPMNKFRHNLSFIETTTAFSHPKLVNLTTHTKSGWKDASSETERGRLSEVMGVTCKDDPDKARGKAGKLVAFEESGVFPQLETAWTVAEESVRQGDLVYGFMLSGGTGGTKGADFYAAEKMFYSPEAYNILPLRNVFSKSGGKGICSFFVPGYVSFEEAYDGNGNSDVIKALVRILFERQKIRNSTKDSNRLIARKAEVPITPEEAVLRTEGSVFPVLEIKEYLSTIYPILSSFVSGHYTGDLVITSGGKVEFKNRMDAYPIRNYPLKSEQDSVGALEIFELPIFNNKDPFRYIIGVDPVENDESLYSTSLASMIVFDRYTRRIVAEYTGRPKFVDDFNEMVYRTCLFYNAKVMYENQKKGLYAYFHSIKKADYLLADYPEHLKDKVDMRGRILYGNTAKGFSSSLEVKRYGRRLQVTWLTSPAYGETVPDSFGEESLEGKEPKPTLLNLHKVRSIAYLEEASQWNSTGNFDRVDAMTAVMIYDRELSIYEDTGESSIKSSSRISNDPFFDRVYSSGNSFGYRKTKNIYI